MINIPIYIVYSKTVATTAPGGAVVKIHYIGIWGVILEEFFTLNSMVMVVLTSSELSMTFKLRSKVMLSF